ncbi:ATP-grasp domain-containing protein [Streptomyces sp. NBC_01431]|uniref:ATP-grasp domain-containing protein n=1 Tax=Streptomyces sp. NBC_01431 TaxID=2903863 RepID=UPI002E2EECEC|nr:ATP-grasp domain-containing protein [Streptomyces sp. NBC_01431]
MITSLNDARDVLRNARTLGFTPRPFLLLPLLRAGCLAALVSGQQEDAGWAARFGVECFSAEEFTRLRDDAGGRREMRHLLPRADSLLSRRWHGREMRLASYGQWWPEWRAELDKSGVRVVAPPVPPLPEYLVDKTLMRPWLRSLGLPTPDDTVVAELDLTVLSRKLGSSFVVQQPRGTGGHGTYLVHDGQQVDGAGDIPEGGPWLVSRYAKGVPINQHGLVTFGGTVHVLPASVQLTDLKGAGAPFGSYSGCDFGAARALPATARGRARHAVERVGRRLADMGYRGTFGVDLVVRGDDVVTLEVNCRMQSSTWLLGELELAAGVLPTQVRHVLEQHGHGTAGESLSEADAAVQLILRHSGPPARVARAPHSGRYTINPAGEAVWRGEGCCLTDCSADELAVIHLPRPGTVLAPGAALARLISRLPLTNPDGHILTTYGKEAMTAVASLFALDEMDMVRARTA